MVLLLAFNPVSGGATVFSAFNGAISLPFRRLLLVSDNLRSIVHVSLSFFCFGEVDRQGLKFLQISVIALWRGASPPAFDHVNVTDIAVKDHQIFDLDQKLRSLPKIYVKFQKDQRSSTLI